jgi:hypothetical protein
LLAPVFGDQPDSVREFVLGRALARVLAHELYHILTQSENHADSGVAKAALSVADLMGSRFEFDSATIGLIRGPLTGLQLPEPAQPESPAPEPTPAR